MDAGLEDAPDGRKDGAVVAAADATVDGDAATDDGGQDAGADAGLPASDPGQIACVGDTCVPGTTRCCIQPSGTQCLAVGSGTCGATEINCDETDDCESNHVCCLGRDDSNDAWSTYCQSTCGADQVRVCKSNAECAPEACLPITCGTRTIGTCGGRTPISYCF